MSESDPWGLLDQELISKHCLDKKAKVIMYDHTGAIKVRCGCGEEYWHSHGAYGNPPWDEQRWKNFLTNEEVKLEILRDKSSR